MCQIVKCYFLYLIMSMNRSVFRYLQMIFLISILLGSTSCGKTKKYNKEETEETIEAENGSLGELTIEEATKQISGYLSETSPQDDMFESYRNNNILLQDLDAPFNKGDEPLLTFVTRFTDDVRFQKERTRLFSEGLYAMDYGKGLLDILLPDSSNYFASWSLIESNRAVFCNGWLGSEVNKEYVFSREEDGKWYLVEYFSAMEEQ